MKDIRKLFLFCLIIANALPANILTNPDFEDDDMSAWTREAISGIRPWSKGSATAQSGEKYLFTVDEARLSQSFDATSIDSIVSFSFWIDRPETASIFLKLSYDDGSNSGLINISSATSPGWNEYVAIGDLAPSKNLIEIEITKLGTGTARLDNFTLALEPPSVAMAINEDNVNIEFVGTLQYSYDCKLWIDFDPQPSSPYSEEIGATKFFRARSE